MHISKKVILLFLHLVVFSAAGLTACQASPTAPDVVASVMSAYEKIDTVKSEGQTNMTSVLSRWNGSENVTALTERTGETDIVSKALHVSEKVDAYFSRFGKRTWSGNIYVIDNWLYMIEVFRGDEQWRKIKLDNDKWKNTDLLAQQIEFLNTASEVSLGQDEIVDGVDSYVLVVKPDTKVLTRPFLNPEQGLRIGVSDNDTAKAVKSYSIKEWIAKDTYLPVRANIEMTLEMLFDDVGGPAGSSVKQTIVITIQARFFDYNKPVAIELPDEARNAQDVGSVR